MEPQTAKPVASPARATAVAPPAEVVNQPPLVEPAVVEAEAKAEPSVEGASEAPETEGSEAKAPQPAVPEKENRKAGHAKLLSDVLKILFL